LTPKICVSIIPFNLTDALKQIAKAEKLGADFIEVRLDEFDTDSDLAVLAADRNVPLIATDKAERDATERRVILLNAAKSGFQYVDADLATPKLKSIVGEIKASGAKCIISSHDNCGCPTLSELHAILKKEVSDGADLCKIVATAKQMQDNLTLLQFTSEVSEHANVVCFGMGELGITSRLLSPEFGAFFTFAALERGSETAPGQMTLGDMRAAYELLRLK
jgi:3-dehydroquinate dehydratase type I